MNIRFFILCSILISSTVFSINEPLVVTADRYAHLLALVEQEKAGKLPQLPKGERTRTEAILIEAAKDDAHNAFITQVLHQLSTSTQPIGSAQSFAFALYNAAGSADKNLVTLIEYFKTHIKDELPGHLHYMTAYPLALRRVVRTADPEMRGLALHAAVENFRHENAARLLAINPFAVNDADGLGRTPLHIVVDRFAAKREYSLQDARTMIVLLKYYYAENVATEKMLVRPSEYAATLASTRAECAELVRLIQPPSFFERLRSCCDCLRKTELHFD